jgi:hypothetical protein
MTRIRDASPRTKIVRSSSIGLLALIAGAQGFACEDSSELGNSGTGGADAVGGAIATGGTAGTIPTQCPEVPWRDCFGEPVYCETTECVGIQECRCGEGRCRCVWELPGSGGANGELEPTPDPYPGAPCPIEPPMVGGSCFAEAGRCTYTPDAPICCVGYGSEDPAFEWEPCASLPSQEE